MKTQQKLTTIFFLALLTFATHASAKTVTLAWDPNTEPNVAGYKIYYRADSSALPFAGTGAAQGNSPVDAGQATTLTLTDLADDKVHYFAVTAYDTSGYESSYSNIIASSAVTADTNQPPVLAAIGAKAGIENVLMAFSIQATDSDGDTLSYSASQLPPGASFNQSTRTFSWTPGYAQAGTHQVTFSVSDGNATDSETIAINIGDVNRPPTVAPIGQRSIAENQPLSIVVEATDPDGDAITVSASGLPAGAVFEPTTHRLNWQPTFDQSGEYHVTFRVSDGKESASRDVRITVAESNRAPVIGGTPPTAATAGQSYHFVPTAHDDDGQPLTFTISGRPSWASFDARTGVLTGTAVQGSYPDILISVSDGQASASLAPFAIHVVEDTPVDSDGDGVSDSDDAFPLDPNETADADGDGIGNNADPDDDNDGVVDTRDAFPNDSEQSQWLIEATAGPGGYIIPAGDIGTDHGQSMTFTIAAKKGYALETVVVDGQTVGALESYSFDQISNHHTIEAVFSPLGDGLSPLPDDDGIPGIRRGDGGSDSDNLVNGKARADLDFNFRIALKDQVLGPALKVYLILNGYALPMSRVSGEIENGAVFATRTPLGPAPRHQYHFEARDENGDPVWFYPETGEIAGPAIYLLKGRNIVALTRDLADSAVGLTTLLDASTIYRWESSGLSSDRNKGQFMRLAPGETVAGGNAFLLKGSSDSLLPDLVDLPQVTTPEVSVALKPGWNIVANPYPAPVPVAGIMVKRGANETLPWPQAADLRWVVDGIYRYDGDDWGAKYSFVSVNSDSSTTLVPGYGYWLYLAADDETYSLVIPQPER